MKFTENSRVYAFWRVGTKEDASFFIMTLWREGDGPLKGEYRFRYSKKEKSFWELNPLAKDPFEEVVVKLRLTLEILKEASEGWIDEILWPEGVSPIVYIEELERRNIADVTRRRINNG